jgi:hypothetical protein
VPELPEGVEVLALAGGQDPLVQVDQLRALAGPGRRTVVVPGVDHSWWSGLDILRREVAQFVGTLVAAAASREST